MHIIIEGGVLMVPCVMRERPPLRDISYVVVHVAHPLPSWGITVPLAV